MPCRSSCRLYIHLTLTYYVGPSNVVWNELGPAPPFLVTNESAWSVMVTGAQSRVWSGPNFVTAILPLPSVNPIGRSQRTWKTNDIHIPKGKDCIYKVCGVITLLGVQLSFHGPSKYNNEMLEMLGSETYIHIEVPTSHCYNMGAHVAESCYGYVRNFLIEHL